MHKGNCRWASNLRRACVFKMPRSEETNTSSSFACSSHSHMGASHIQSRWGNVRRGTELGQRLTISIRVWSSICFMLRPSSLARVSLSVNIALHQLKSKKKKEKQLQETQNIVRQRFTSGTVTNICWISLHTPVYFFFSSKRSALISGVDILKLFRFSDITNQIWTFI